MFGLVRFADNSYWIYSMKNIIAKDCKDDTCLVKHKGAKYEAVLIATNGKLLKFNGLIEQLKVQLIRAILVPTFFKQTRSQNLIKMIL